MSKDKQPLRLPLQILVNVEDISDAFAALPNEEALAVILRLDLRVADVGFTEELVKALLKSLKGDLREEFNLNDYIPK
jgi:hypothetical protein